MFLCFLFLIFFIKVYVVGTHSICLNKVDKNYTGCNLINTELLDCALIGVCAVIRSNTVVMNGCPAYTMSFVKRNYPFYSLISWWHCWQYWNSMRKKRCYCVLD